MAYRFLSLETVLKWEPVAAAWDVSDVARGPRGFIAQYRKTHGRGAELPEEWHSKRENFCARHLAQIERFEGGRLFDPDDGLPTRHAMALVMWAYHPEPRKLERVWQQLLKDAEDEQAADDDDDGDGDGDLLQARERIEHLARQGLVALGRRVKPGGIAFDADVGPS